MRGLVPLLRRMGSEHTFERKSPIRRRHRPRPPKEAGYGRTGISLARQIEKLLTESLKADDRCDLILVIDDLDCHDAEVRRELFDRSIMNVDKATSIDHYIGFASPEIEAWIVADWDHSVARDPDFRSCHNQMRHWLSSKKDVSFAQPETFSGLDEDRGSCVDKLSDAIVESSVQCGARSRYSKGVHTARLLHMISPEIVHSKCPLFRELRNRLTGKE